MEFSDAMLLRMTVHERTALLQRLIVCGALDVIGPTLMLKAPVNLESDLSGVETKASRFNLRVALVQLLSALSGDDVRPFELKSLPPPVEQRRARFFLRG